MVDHRSWIRGLLKGRDDTFEEMLTYFRPKIWRYLCRKVPVDDAEDVFQEVWLTVMTTIHRLQEPDHLAGWVFAIVRFKVLEYYRARARQPNQIDAPCLDLPDTPAAPFSQEEQLFIREVHRAILGLGDAYREIAVLHFIVGLKVNEIVQVTDANIHTVKSCIQRAKAQIYKRIKGTAPCRS